MKEIKKARIRLGKYAIDIETVKSVSFSLDGRTVLIVDAEGREYATAIQNVVIITEEIADGKTAD